MGGAGSWDDNVGFKVAVGTWRVMDRDDDRQKQCSTLFCCLPICVSSTFGRAVDPEVALMRLER